MADEKSARSKGVVAKFDDHKSYGFIQLDDGGEDLFVHQTAGFRNFCDQAVEFTIVLKDENSKAVDVTAPGGGLVRRGGDINNRGGNGGGYGFGDRRNGPGRGGVGGECYNCGEFGHMDRDCFCRIGGGANGSSCYNCGGYGHLARVCPIASCVGGGNGGACFACSDAGHMAMDCMGGGSNRGGCDFGGPGEAEAAGWRREVLQLREVWTFFKECT